MRSLYDRECPETWRKSFNRTQNGNKFDGFRQNNNRIMYTYFVLCYYVWCECACAMFDLLDRIQGSSTSPPPLSPKTFPCTLNGKYFFLHILWLQLIPSHRITSFFFIVRVSFLFGRKFRLLCVQWTWTQTHTHSDSIMAHYSHDWIVFFVVVVRVSVVEFLIYFVHDSMSIKLFAR